MTPSIAADLGAFNGQPLELVFHTFTFLDGPALAKVARVCRLFREVANDPKLWKPLYLRSFRLKEQGVELRLSWKACFARRFKLPNPKYATDYRYFWRFGFPVDAVHAIKENRGVLPSELGPIYAALCESTKAKEELKNLDSNDLQQSSSAARIQILTAFAKGQTITAWDLYLTHRETLMKTTPLIGWWFSKLFYKIRAERMEKEQMIFFPQFKGQKTRDQEMAFIEGSIFSWLALGLIPLVAASLECRGEILIKNSQQDNRQFFNQFIAALQQQKPNWAALKAISLALKSSPEHALTAASLALSCPSYTPVQEKLFLAAYVMDLLVSLHKGNPSFPTDLWSNMCLSLFQMAYRKRMVFNSDILLAFMNFASYFKIRQHYEPLLNLAAEIPESEIRPSDRLSFYLKKMHLRRELFYLIGNYRENVEDWLLVCSAYQDTLLSGIKVETDIYQPIYDLMDSHRQICLEVASLDLQERHAIPAKAYALYRLGRVDESLRTILSAHRSLKTENLEWLLQCAEKNFNAAVIYSLLLTDPEALEEFYLNQVDCHPYKEFYCYHNLSARLYFEGYFHLAFKYIELSLEHCTDEFETFYLKGLIHRKLGQKEAEAEAFAKAASLQRKHYLDRLGEKDLILLVSDEAQ